MGEPPNVVRISRGADTTARARFPNEPGLDRARAVLTVRRRRLHALVIPRVTYSQDEPTRVPRLEPYQVVQAPPANDLLA